LVAICFCPSLFGFLTMPGVTWRAPPGLGLTHRSIALEPELFAESGVGGAGGVLGVDGELDFPAAAADLGALGGF
jgi:hypothetical protein